MELSLFDPDGYANDKPRPREWPALDIANRRGCTARQQRVLAWLYARAGYQAGTARFRLVDALRDGAAESDSGLRCVLRRLVQLGLIQRDSAPWGQYRYHVLRAHQPDLQSYFEFFEDPPPGGSSFFCLFPNTYAHARTYLPADGGAAAPRCSGESAVASSAQSEACEQSARHGTGHALRRHHPSSTSEDVQSLGEGDGMDVQADRGLRPSGGNSDVVEPSHGSHAFREALGKLPSTENIVPMALQIYDQFRALGDKRPMLIPCAKIAILRCMSEEMAEAIARIFRQAPHIRKGNPPAWAMGGIKIAMEELLGMPWDDFRLIPRTFSAVKAAERKLHTKTKG